MTAIRLNKRVRDETGDDLRPFLKADGTRSPFSQEKLNEIFKISQKYPDRIISRESSNLEFKESFGWNSIAKYLKTCAAFANAKGGYIVFGIGRQPHSLLGLSGNSLEQFEDMNIQKMTGHLNDHFSPEIAWDIHAYELDAKTFGILYIHECHDKPVLCKKNSDTVLKEGDVYYRYRGRSERVRYPELRAILDLKRENEQRLWMQHISEIARVGVRETGIFDLKNGIVTGTSGSLLIDESLLSQLSFIKEGEFCEVKGKPTLKVIGGVEVISGLATPKGHKRIVKTRGIRISDIVLAFLNLDRVDEPLEYVKQICFESTGFLPVHYFLHLSKIDRIDAIAEVKAVVSRSQAKSKLLDRLEEKNSQSLNKPTSYSEASRKKNLFINQLNKKEIDPNITDKDLEYCLQSIRMLQPVEVRANSEYIRSTLKIWFNKHYSSAPGAIADNLRRAICWVDEALYEEGTK